MSDLLSPNASTSGGARAPVSDAAIEYMTRDLFKGKSLLQAARAFHQKFGGQRNIFLGVVDQSVEELMAAVLRDKANVTITGNARMKPGNGLMALKASAHRFNLHEKDLAKAVLDVLANGSPAITVKGPDPVACAVTGLNAAHPVMRATDARVADEGSAEEETIEQDAAPAPRA